MYKFYDFIDNYITKLLMDNLDIKKELLDINKVSKGLKSPSDILLLDDKELLDLLHYLVIDNASDVMFRIKGIKLNNDNNSIYLNNLLKDINERIELLIDSLTYKLKNNNLLIDRVYFIYNAFKNGVLSGEIVDFNMVNKILYMMNIGDDEKQVIINQISNNNLEIYKDRQLVNIKYYLSIEEYDLFYQCYFLINKKKDLLKKTFSLNYDNVDFYELYNNCVVKLDEISNVLDDIMAGISLFESCGNAEERKLLLDDKKNFFDKIELLLNQYYELEEDVADYSDNQIDDITDNLDSNVNIIYLTKGHNGEGDILFSDYLKNVPFEYYGKLMKMLKKLCNKSNNNNLANNKVLVGPLKGLWEIKAFKLRIYYKKLSDNDILVLFCDTKKANETLAKNRYVDMLKNWDSEIKYIENVMSIDSKEKEDLIMKNKKIHEDVIEYMSGKGRNMK